MSLHDGRFVYSSSAFFSVTNDIRSLNEYVRGLSLFLLRNCLTESLITKPVEKQWIFDYFAAQSKLVSASVKINIVILFNSRTLLVELDDHYDPDW